MSVNPKVNFDSKLLYYIKLGWDNVVKSMLTMDLCMVFDNWGTLLHYAAFYGNDAIIRHLVELGSDIDAFGIGGHTPLMLAIVREHLDAVKMLLEDNADIDVANSDGVSALQMVFDPRYFEPSILRVFLNTVQGEAFCDEDLVDRLIEAGCSLYHAASLKDVNIIGLMLSRGMDINSGGYCGKTALHAAVELYDVKLALMLMKNGADANVFDENSTTALFIAASRGRNDMVELLLENGADPNIGEIGHTPFFAVYVNSAVGLQERFFDCAELLLQHGAEPLNPQQDRYTLLDHALFRRDSAKVKLLIAHLALLEMTGTQNAKSVMCCNAEEYAVEYPMFEEYYTMCQQTLRMKVLGKWTVLDLMTANEHKMRSHARNWRLVPKIFEIFMEHNLSDEYPYYFNILWIRVSRAMKTVKLEDNAIAIVRQIFNAGHNASYIFAREVLSYLNDYELEQLCRV